MITDFGIARAGDEPGASASGAIGPGGTPSYMAPEQIGGGRGAVGPPSDVFALGATLYSLLTGRPPFQGASAVETLDLVRLSEPAAPRTLIPGLPRDLETIVLTCLRKDPRRRYASAGALAADLRRWLGGFPIRARPASRLEHAGRWCRRRPAIALLLAALALTVASSLVGLLALWRSADAHRLRAEDSLARALENEEAAARMGRDLIGVLATNVDVPHMLTGERLDFSARVMREIMEKLRQDRSVDESSLSQIRGLVRQLSVDFLRRGKFAESRRLLVELLGLLEVRSRRAEGWRIDAERAMTLLDMASFAGREGRTDLTLEDIRRAEKILEGVDLDLRQFNHITWIDSTRWEIAGILGARGLAEPRRRVLEANLRMLDHLSEGSRDDSRIAILAALTRAELAADFGSIATILRSVIEKLPADGRFPDYLEERVACWIIGGIELCPPVGGTSAGIDPNAQAHAVVGMLESRCQALGVRPALLAAAARNLADLAGTKSSQHRNAGRLDDARRISACLSAIAGELLSKNPNELEYHLLMSTAFTQEAKNAWPIKDYPVIEDRLRKALAEARKALRLDPHNVAARNRVAVLQDKLIDLIPERPPAR